MAEASLTFKSDPQPDEAVLAQFLADLDRDGEAVLSDYARRYPPLAQELHSLAAMQRRLRAPAADDAPIPRHLGEFFLLRRIASGGMGEVYEAIQHKLNRRVAIKTVRRGQVEPRWRERFLREQRVLAKLHHTHIVPIHTAGEEAGLQYFAMPYIDGAPLHRLVRLVSELSEGDSSASAPSIGELVVMAVGHEAAGPRATGDSLATTCDAATPRAAGFVDDETLRIKSTSAPATGTPLSRRRKLSLEYYRSVATVMAEAADALDHAHQAHVLHRDMKPSNIMVDAQGHCWLIDFGLAGYLHASRERPAETGALPDTAASGFVGTLHYMAPEQLKGRADVRTDVWGLGVTLYELLTLQKAFPGATQPEVYQAIESAEPTLPRRLIANAPHDLAAICRKALRKAPVQRYQTAGEFADDLRRWLRREPTAARPARAPRRALLWSRRNKGWAGAIAVSILSVAALLIASRTYITSLQRRDLLQQQLALRKNPHSAGWSQEAWDLVARANDLKPGDDLREPAAAALAGPDAHLGYFRKEIGVSTAAWSADGKRLLLGGDADKRGAASHEARIWDLLANTDKSSGLAGEGPVAWRSDGVAIQAVAKDARTIVLWDVDQNRLVHELVAPAVEPLAADHERAEPLLALARDASTVALAARSSDINAKIWAWNTGMGKNVLDVDFAASAVAISPGGRLLAAGNDDGHIRIWTMGQPEPVAALSIGRSAIEALAFGRDLWNGPGPGTTETAEGPLLLAASDAGGQVTIWDLSVGQARTFCRGTTWDVSHISFSPDSAILATGGRQKVRLWNVATGQSLLELAADDSLVGLDFSPDGRRLAVCGHDGNGRPAGLMIYEILDSRGMQLLHGLRAPVIQVRFSRDGRHIAAISSDWQLAVWDAATGRLRRAFAVPKGLTADNAGFAVSPDGGRIAFATSGAARLWDIETGNELRRWALPPGLQDQLAFHHSGNLLLVRAEFKSGLGFNRRNRDGDPLVCRVYDLLGDDPSQPIAPDVHGFDRRVNALVFSCDGQVFVVDGYLGPGDTHRHVAAFDGLTAKPLWDHKSAHENPHAAALCIDPLGTTVSAAMPDSRIFDARTGDFLGVSPNGSGSAIGPGGQLSLGGHRQYGYDLYHLSRGVPLLKLGIDSLTSSYVTSFNAAGTHVAWGNADGTVALCDIPLVRRRLAELGLDWSE
ncbi:MAG TPA: protein kinase [Pirellulales bacterium]|nr:protein kinase [Pirellulales bacterium]